MVTIETLQAITGSSWEITWSSDIDGAIFNIFVDGELVARTAETVYVVNVTDGSPLIEIFDDDSAPSKTYPRNAVIAFYWTAGAAYYRIEQQDGSDWVLRQTIADDGRGYFVWRSAAIPDSTMVVFRVTALGANGNLGTVAQLSLLMVTYPQPPALTMSYSSSTGKATFLAA